MTNETPTIYNEGYTVERLNSLMDEVTSKRFLSAALAAQTIRACLDLHSISLPHLEVEGGSGTTTADGPFILQGVQSMDNPNMYAPPTEGEWLFKIQDSDGPDNDFDDTLWLYIVMDMDEDNLVDCFAQVITDKDLDDISKYTDMTDDEYQDQKGRLDYIPHEGDRSGESEYQKDIRHIGSLKIDR